MFLLSDVIEQVRELTQDQVEPYRFDDARLYRLLNNAFTATYSIRPDIFVDLQFKIPYVSSTNSTDTFPLDQQYYPAFVDYVTAMLELTEDEFTVDGRAVTLLQMFRSQIGGKAS